MPNKEFVITLCDGPACIHKKSRPVRDAIEAAIKKHQLADKVRIHLSGCLGMCDKGPIMIVNPGYTMYGSVTPEDAAEIVEQHVLNNSPVARLIIDEDHLYNRFFRIFGDTNTHSRF